MNHVFMNSQNNKVSCIVLTRTETTVRFVSIRDDVFQVNSLETPYFDDEWTAVPTCTLETAIATYMKSERVSNGDRAVRDELLSLLPTASPAATVSETLPPDVSQAAPASDTVVQTASSDEVIVPPSSSPVLPADNNSPPAASPVATIDPKKEKPMNSPTTPEIDPQIAAAHGVQVAFAEGALVIQLAKPALRKFVSADFAGKEQLTNTVQGLCFYAAFNDKDLLERNVAITEGDRLNIAAMVGNWVAEGFRIEHCTRRVLMKHLRKLNAGKDDEEETGGSPASNA